MFCSDPAYQRVVDMISKVQACGLLHKLNIPRMAIIGDQSSGKSSVLEAITKLSFPRNKGMCTRFVTQVNLRRDPTLQEDMISARIDGEGAFNESFSTVKAPVTFQSVIEEAVTLLCTDSNPISDKILEITISGPTQLPLTIIDLPGFITTTLNDEIEDLPEIIRTINRRYIRSPRTVILAVVNAENDLNTSTSLAEAGAQGHDPEGERTITIVTKVDRIERGHHTDWIEVLNNRRKTMKLGYLAMRNTSFDEKSMSWDQAREEEESLFRLDQWSAVDINRKGREAVRGFLSNVLYEHISKELPALKREVDSALDSFKRDLRVMGTPIVCLDEARTKLYKATLLLQPRVNDFLKADYDYEYVSTFKNKATPSSGLDPYFVRASLQNLYYDYRAAMTNECNRVSTDDIQRQVSRYKGSDIPGFVSITTFKNIVRGHYLDGWRSVTMDYVFKMHSHLSEALMEFISHVSDGAARDVFTHIFNQFSRKKAKKIEKIIMDIFEDESSPFTLSRTYLETVDSERSKIKKQPPISCKTTTTVSNEYSIFDIIDGRSPKSPQPQSNDNSWHEDVVKISPTHQMSEANWNDQHTASEMKLCLIAYLEAARERIVDKVLMETIERHMFIRIGDYFKLLSEVTDGDLECMLESPALKSRRKELNAKIVDFEEIMYSL
ncbi:hypothetical protein BGW38_002806 [Lunasporangiospora selenospora]|uniref:Dynamin family protein n=1 Tax=Lunasporangiospora selenospora TaxID=979761 RepID=A0A9P6G331_9FUNG|nr:hypothetical protein BGW38_002806 [Lunasporangiospora selenospora]